MRILIAILMIGILAFLLSLFLPWYAVGIAAFLITSFGKLKKGFHSFISGFFGGAILWGIFSYLAYLGNSGIIADKMAELFQFSGGLSMVFIASLIAGLCAGFSGLTGFYLREILQGEPQKARV